jgi:two-component system, cell cycle sensor histidine kinase and response regulator CckA
MNVQDSLMAKHPPFATVGPSPITAGDAAEIKKNQDTQGASHDPRIDLTEPRSERTILASEISYRRLFEAARDGILMLDVDTGCITDVNPFLFKLLGFSRGEMVGKTIGELSPFKDIESNQVMLERLQEQGYVRYHDLPLETKGGLKVAVEFISNVYQAGDKKVIQCNIRDITERRQLEAQLIEAQKMEALGQLASGIAHDFNNMLSVIMGYSEILRLKLIPESPLQKHNEQIRRAAERAASLTAQLLVFSRKQTVQPVVLDLNVAVVEQEPMLRRLLDENIAMTIVTGQQTGPIKADPGYIGQVLMNLVINARDAMPNGGRLTIATHNITLDEHYVNTHPGATPGDFVMLSVSDTGVGMTDEVKKHLFEPFFTTKPLGKGTGLGLTTCQTIAKQSGGHIGVYSEVGQGTTLKIYFPQAGPLPQTTAKIVLSGPLPRGTETLLVVEDETLLRYLACSVLEAQGYTVQAAANGQEALQVVCDHQGPPIRLVVTDVVMPLMDGKVMAERLQATYPEIKILFTSGYTDDAIAHHGVLDPGVAFLPKPYTPATLARKVRDVLDAMEVLPSP